MKNIKEKILKKDYCGFQKEMNAKDLRKLNKRQMIG